MYIRYPYENKFETLNDDLNLDEINPDSFISDRQMPPPVKFPNFQQNIGGNKPPMAPPNFTPNKSNYKSSPQLKSVSPGSLGPCTYQYSYIWLNNGNSFWAWLICVDRYSAFGFRWNGRKWVHFGVDLKRINYFECYGNGYNQNKWYYNQRDNENSNLYIDEDVEENSRKRVPNNPPPEFTPNKSDSKNLKTVSSNSLKPCTYQYVYLWLKDGSSFWAWLTMVDRKSVSGYKWHCCKWIYFGLDLNKIDYFECYRRSPSENIYTDDLTEDVLYLKPLDYDCLLCQNPNLNRNYNTPPAPPPDKAPKKSQNMSPQLKSVSPGSLKPCLYQYVYIWLNNGNSFWAWLTRVDKRTASGYRWKRNRWVYFGIDLRKIDYFECFYREMQTDEKVSQVDEITKVSDYIYDKKISPDTFSLIYPFFNNLNSKVVENTLNNLIIDKYLILLKKELFSHKKFIYTKIFGSYSLSLQKENIASFLFYMYSYGLNNKESISYESLTINYETGDIYELKDLFKSESNYIEKLNQAAKEFIESQNPELLSAFTGIKDTQGFFLTPESLILYIKERDTNLTPDLLALNPIVVPFEKLKSIIDNNSPIGKIIISSDINI